MYSFKMSFCVVPRNCRAEMPCASAVAMYIARRMIAGPLIVIEVETRSSGMPRKSVSMSSSEEMATPPRPTSPSANA